MKLGLPHCPSKPEFPDESLGSPLFPSPNKLLQRAGILACSAEKVNVIRHDHVPGDVPAMAGGSGLPFID
jgi:hypothetical protein